MSDSQDQIKIVQVFTRYQRTIQAYAYAIVHDMHLAEDVTQEVAIVLATEWQSVAEREDLTSWLLEVTRRKALESSRRSGRSAVTLSEEVLEQVGDQFSAQVSTTGTGSEDSAMMAECVGRLVRVSQRVVHARYAESLTCEEIAAQIGRSVQSVYSILKRARLMLVQCFERKRIELSKR